MPFIREQQELTPEAFHGFLQRLNPEPALAAEAYEELRLLLIRFFEWHDSWFPEEDTDETLNRVIRKSAENNENIQNITAYALGVARFVNLEMRRAPDRRRVELDTLLPFVSSEKEAPTDEAEVLYEYFQDCLQSLSQDNQTFLYRYYQYEHSARIRERQKMAQELKLTSAALRRRAQRLRAKLEQCVNRKEN